MTKEQLKKKRLELKLNQEQLAEKMGYSRRETVSEKETGKRGISKQDEIILKSL